MNQPSNLSNNSSRTKRKTQAGINPLLNQMNAIRSQYGAEKKPIEDALNLKQKLKNLDQREANEKKALADKKAADIKHKVPTKDINKKYDADMKALNAKYKTETFNSSGKL